MPSQVGSIIRRATKSPNEKYNVLSCVTHERYASNMADCHANFYLLQNGHGVKGNWVKNFAEIPPNHHILPPYQNNPLEVIPDYVELDMVIAQHRVGQAQVLLPLAQYLSLPTIVIEHCTVTADNMLPMLDQFKQMRGDINIFISEVSAKAWSWSLDDESVLIIKHGVDTELFRPSGRPRKKQILTVGNDMQNREIILGFDTFKRVCQGLPVKIVGDTKGLSVAAKNVFELKQQYDESQIYFNPSRHSPIPMSCLEAASVGCCIVTTSNNMLPDIFQNEINGIISNDEGYLRSKLQELLERPDECARLGQNARQTIIDKFSLKDFTSNWDRVFDKLAKLRK